MAFRRRRIFGRTESVDETRALAAALAGLTGPGDLVVLAGDLGAGKTAFVQGFGQALGVTEPITSPTFALAQRYDGARGRILHHLDVYRLEQLHEVLDLDIAELLDQGGTVVVEWGDAVTPALPNDYLEVTLALGDEDQPDERRLTVHPVGPRWCQREEAIAAAIKPWAEPGTGGTDTSASASAGGAIGTGDTSATGTGATGTGDTGGPDTGGTGTGGSAAGSGGEPC